MRKAILILFLFLVACGNNSEQELSEFISSFNENEDRVLSVKIDRIHEELIGEVEGNVRLLSENKYRYKIYAKYNSNNLVGYQIEIHPEDSFRGESMAGFDAGKIIASTLELDKKKFETEYSEALVNGENTYSDNGYEISFYNYFTADGEFNGATIDFDKKSD